MNISTHNGAVPKVLHLSNILGRNTQLPNNNKGINLLKV